jgi:hypothetical protein
MRRTDMPWIIVMAILLANLAMILLILSVPELSPLPMVCGSAG